LRLGIGTRVILVVALRINVLAGYLTTHYALGSDSTKFSKVVASRRMILLDTFQFLLQEAKFRLLEKYTWTFCVARLLVNEVQQPWSMGDGRWVVRPPYVFCTWYAPHTETSVKTFGSPCVAIILQLISLPTLFLPRSKQTCSFTATDCPR